MLQNVVFYLNFLWSYILFVVVDKDKILTYDAKCLRSYWICNYWFLDTIVVSMSLDDSL